MGITTGLVSEVRPCFDNFEPVFKSRETYSTEGYWEFKFSCLKLNTDLL